MKLDLKFDKLDIIRRNIGAPYIKLAEINIEKTTLDILRSDEGVEVDIYEDVSFGEDNSLIHKETGKPILLYIREPFGYTPKYHIASCSTLKGYIDSGRIDRYVAAYRDKENPSTRFKVNLLQPDGSRKGFYKNLDVCKNCLKELDYNGYASYGRLNKENIYSSFEIIEFFEKYDNSQHKYTPRRQEYDMNIDEYPPNWEMIKRLYRKKVDFCCESCGINLSENQKFLHVHHISGYKGDSSDGNLKALCIKCHASQPQHEHMRRLLDYKSFLMLYDNYS